MTTTIVLSVLVGAAASSPLLKWGRRLGPETVARVERQCSRFLLPLLMATVGLLFVLYPFRFGDLMVLGSLVAAAGGVFKRDSGPREGMGVFSLARVITSERPSSSAPGRSLNEQASPPRAGTPRGVQRERSVGVWGYGRVGDVEPDAHTPTPPPAHTFSQPEASQSQTGLRRFAAVIVIGIVLAEAALANATAGGFPYQFPGLVAWIGGDRAQPALMEALKHNHPFVRMQAIEALAQVNRPPIDTLVATLADPSEEVREAAAKALVDIGSGGVPLLVKTLGEGDVRAREMAARVLHEIGQPTVPDLIAALREGQSETRQMAARVLTSIGPPAVPALVAELGYSDPVMEILVKIGSSAVPALKESLKDENRFVRRQAATALGQIGDERAVPALLDAVQDGTEDVREQVAKALIKLGAGGSLAGLGAPAIPALIAAMRDGDVHWQAGEALIIIGRPAVPALIAALNSEHMHVRWEAVRVLGKIKAERAVPVLMAALKDREPWVRQQAAEALGDIGRRGAMPGLVTALKDQDPSVRGQAAEALGRLGSKRAVPVLIVALNDHEPWVRQQAAIALGQIGDKRAIPALIAAVKNTAHPARSEAIEALGKMNDKRAVPVLIGVLKGRDWGMAEQAAQALGRIDDKRAIPALKAARFWIRNGTYKESIFRSGLR